MADILKAQYYRSGRPNRPLINVTYRDGGGKSGLAEAILPELRAWLAEGHEILPADPKGYPAHVRPAYLAHELCLQPSDDAKIWRYMGFNQLVSLLSEKALWFSRTFAFRETLNKAPQN